MLLPVFKVTLMIFRPVCPIEFFDKKMKYDSIYSKYLEENRLDIGLISGGKNVIVVSKREEKKRKKEKNILHLKKETPQKLI